MRESIIYHLRVAYTNELCDSSSHLLICHKRIDVQDFIPALRMRLCPCMSDTYNQYQNGHLTPKQFGARLLTSFVGCVHQLTRIELPNNRSSMPLPNHVEIGSGAHSKTFEFTVGQTVTLEGRCLQSGKNSMTLMVT